ncbi:MAG: hypothetical protein BZ151_04015 [Desulfobacca sp. 4484_104]|nr:MAG: hypothetical protein BZ151_04015 [Desulfobacca sp. 4484_104]
MRPFLLLPIFRQGELTLRALGRLVKAEPMEHRPRLISGDDLIQEFHLTPGPQFRQLLEAVEEACLEGRISTRQQALDLVKKLL